MFVGKAEASTNLNLTYSKRAEVQINIDGITGPASTNIYGTSFGVPNTVIMTLNETNGWSATGWVDSGTEVTIPAALYVNENERWLMGMNQDYRFTVDLGAFVGMNNYHTHQYRNLYVATGLSGNNAVNITGTYLGSPITIANLSSSNSWTAFGWSDTGTTATYPASSSQSTSQERWTIGNPYITEAITFGGGIYGKAYTHQYNVTFQYSTSDGKAIPDGTIIGSYTQFGQELTLADSSQYQTALPAFDWVDAQTQVRLQNYTNTLNTNRWILTDSPAQLTVTAPGNLNLGMYYHQVANTLTATGLSGTDIVKVQGTYYGKSAVIATLNSPNGWSSPVWSDIGSTITFQDLSDNSGVGERWILDDNSAYPEEGGFAIVKEYIHQCRVVFAVSGDGLAQKSGFILTVNNIKLDGTQLPYQTAWVTAGSQLSFAYQNFVANSNDSQYFWTKTSGLGQSGQTGTLTVTAPGTVTATYDSEYAITAESNGNGTITPTNAYYIKGTSQTFTITPQEGYHIVDVTVDSESVGPVSSLPLNDIQSGHKIAVTFAEDQNSDVPPTLTPSPSPSASPKISEAGMSNSMVLLSVAASVLLLVSLLVFGLKRSKI